MHQRRAIWIESLINREEKVEKKNQPPIYCISYVSLSLFWHRLIAPPFLLIFFFFQNKKEKKIGRSESNYLLAVIGNLIQYKNSALTLERTSPKAQASGKLLGRMFERKI